MTEQHARMIQEAQHMEHMQHMQHVQHMHHLHDASPHNLLAAAEYAAQYADFAEETAAPRRRQRAPPSAEKQGSRGLLVPGQVVRKGRKR